MRLVQPRLILSADSEAFNYIHEKRQLNQGEQFASGHGNWQCSAAKLENGSHLICVPNLSRYAIDNHPKVAAWIQNISQGVFASSQHLPLCHPNSSESS
jgi:hypothetical protein